MTSERITLKILDSTAQHSNNRTIAVFSNTYQLYLGDKITMIAIIGFVVMLVVLYIVVKIIASAWRK